ncbi:MAG TPA: helical backbone metal receptor [Spirochaetota bacterium]|nr:helical backbone metal receptor [Spirochaetota bacterium]HNT11888.1 helical backbone metal receptor [Spirochaetota bacterium]
MKHAIAARLPLLAALFVFGALYAIADIGARPAPAPRAHGRIVSLSPSITRQIMELGAADAIVGVTTYHPALGRPVAPVGDLSRPSIERIVALAPDVVMYSREDADTQFTELLAATGLPVFVTGANRSFEELCDNFRSLGRLLGRGAIAEERIAAVRARIAAIKRPARRLRIAVLLSHVPLVAASGQSFINGIIESAGGVNVFRASSIPYPVITLEHLVAARPDVLISFTDNPEPLFPDAHGALTAIPAVRRGAMVTLDHSHITQYTPDGYADAASALASILTSLERHIDET